MKTIIRQLIHSIALGTVLPGMLFGAVSDYTATPVLKPQGSTPADPTTITQPLQQGPMQEPDLLMIPVLMGDGTVESMALEEYVSRVVLGEMPASFEKEALKAQAVAARTYTLRCVVTAKKHSQGAVCTDHRCCQAYRDPEDYLQKGGTKENVDKVYDAVSQTEAEVLLYDGKLIMATYFASAGGTTEDAQEVWGNPIPYLTVVSSPEGDDAFNDEILRFSAKEFQDKMGVTLKGKPENWFGRVSYTVGGGVDWMRIGGTLYSGVDLRSRLGLRSTDFTVTTTDDSVVITTNGYGHRVGMSQYGADAMAVQGSEYDQILAHYYPGTELAIYQPDKH